MKKLWHDPVWSKVIAGAILAVAGIIFVYFLQSWPINVPPLKFSTRPTAYVSTCTSVTFNGAVTPNGALTMVWFEWGKTPDLETATPQQTFIKASNFEQKITGLTENTVYYYNAIATNKYGTTRGEVLTFSTPPC